MSEATNSATPAAVELTAAQEDRARQLHREAVVFICHDHTLRPEDLAGMERGGVTAKQLMISVDARMHADRHTFLGSVRGRGFGRESQRQERPPELPTEPVAVRRLGATESEGFLKGALVAIDYVYWQIDHSGGRLRVALEADDIVAAKRDGARALLLGSEGSRLIEDRLEVLRMLFRLGLRHLQLSWAVETTIGAPQSDLSGRGLTEFGHDVVRELNRLGVIVDVSHLAPRAQLDALVASRTPVLNSHTGAARLNPTQPQLLGDDVIRAFAERDGVLAIHFHSAVVKPGRHQAKFGELMAQFEYVARLVGTDHLACGPDYGDLRDARLWENQGIVQPFTMTEGVEDVSRMLNVTRGLVSCGFSDDDIVKIMGGNLLRLFRATRAAAGNEPWLYEPFAEGIGAATGGTTPL